MIKTLIALSATLGVASAATILSVPAADQAAFNKDAGQSLTTPTLGVENLLSSITVYGATSTGAGLGEGFTAKIWANGGGATSWNPTAEIAVSTNTNDFSFGAERPAYTFYFDNVELDDDTVYILSFSREGEDHVSFRLSLSDTDSPIGTNGNSSGSLFGDGEVAFSERSLAIDINVVPEPSVALLGGIGLLGLLRRRR